MAFFYKVFFHDSNFAEDSKVQGLLVIQHIITMLGDVLGVGISGNTTHCPETKMKKKILFVSCFSEEVKKGKTLLFITHFHMMSSFPFPPRPSHCCNFVSGEWRE